MGNGHKTLTQYFAFYYVIAMTVVIVILLLLLLFILMLCSSVKPLSMHMYHTQWFVVLCLMLSPLHHCCGDGITT